ncbi:MULTISPECIES: folate-binding protein [unclassified Actinomyces]|nr:MULTISPECIES: folate-binding protein [unclassified Actinomyces]MCL3778683.1 folate-binding protein YgfZ [Actinomyces sp. AC-20-1]MCL3789964.1 folate-binding protein YgfZ [Actinomyces sp. 187325]MCL3792317.1 folate-binding protein YgfZ [Actinomyces sp. 186855]MCL3794505.1 folate-binding protein YgfZ [Actinomyces sp. 217892]
MRPSPLLDLPGAQPGPDGDLDARVPAHHGSPLREQALLAEGAAVTALARDVVTVTGPDRLTWITTLGSQDLRALTPGDGGAETLLLDAQGRITHALAALDDGQVLWLVTEAGRGPALAGFLDSMRFMLRVEVAPREDVHALGAMGEGLDRLAGAARDQGALLGRWRDPWPGVVDGGTAYDVGLGSPQRPFRHPGEGYTAGLVLVGEEQAGAVVGASGLRPAGSLAWEALRVEAGRPRWGREADERAIPHELDWLRTAVHLTKGCYPGQETIARTLNLGRPPRRLTILQLDGLSGRAPLPGAAVRMGERQVGTVTSVVRHHEAGPMALALLRRATPLTQPLTVDVTEDVEGADGEAQVVACLDALQEPLVSPEGKAGASPAERPGAGLRTSLLHQGPAGR